MHEKGAGEVHVHSVHLRMSICMCSMLCAGGADVQEVQEVHGQEVHMGRRCMCRRCCLQVRCRRSGVGGERC